MPTDLVSASEVAPYYGVTTETITAWAREGRIPVAVTTIGGHRRFRLADVFATLPPATNEAAS